MQNLKRGVVTVGMPKMKERYGLWGTSEKERKTLLSLYYILQNEISYVKSSQDRINSYQQVNRFPGIVLESYNPCPKEAICLEDARQSVAFLQVLSYILVHQLACSLAFKRCCTGQKSQSWTELSHEVEGRGIEHHVFTTNWNIVDKKVIHFAWQTCHGLDAAANISVRGCHYSMGYRCTHETASLRLHEDWSETPVNYHAHWVSQQKINKWIFKKSHVAQKRAFFRN